jgi:hypothetical protein
MDSLQREKDAVRIQAAAVAAQQAALTEEEARLHQRRLALEQQEKQLAAHLEDKRRNLLRLRDEARQARQELQQEQQSHAQHVGSVQTELDRGRQELEESRRHGEAERRRFIRLRRRLQRRWHRHWVAQHQVQAQREAEVARLRKAVEEQQAALVQAQLRVNGERELGRRQLADAWDQLHQAQGALGDRQAEARHRDRQLDRREADLAQAAATIEQEKQQWQKARLHLEMEAEGLENRIRNQRRKLMDLAGSRDATIPSSLPVADPAEGPPPASQPAVPDAHDPCAGKGLAIPEQTLTTALSGPDVISLEILAQELADQRLHLAEQWERLLLAQERWQEDHDAAATELEALALHLREQEKTNRIRDHILTSGEATVRQRLDEVLHLRHHLEGCQARLRSRVAAWEGERDRLLIDVGAREELAERRLQAVAGLRERWEKRRRHELNRCQAVLAAADRLRQEYALLRVEWFRRIELLEQKERDLAEKALALEQYQQECIGQSEDSPAAEKRLGRLRRHWTALSQTAERTLQRERQAFRTEMARFEERNQAIEKLAQEMAVQEARLASRQTAWEHEQALVQAKLEQFSRKVDSLQRQRQRDEQQFAALQDEIEHMARLLMEENDLAMVPVVVQAA